MPKEDKQFNASAVKTKDTLAEEKKQAEKSPPKKNLKKPEKKPQPKKNLSALEKADNFLLRFSRIPHSEKIFLVQQLGVMTKSGISLGKALEILKDQTSNKKMQAILADVHAHILKGRTLSDALKTYTNVFGELFVNMIDAGEKSGTLDKVLKQIYLQMKKNHELISKVRGALTYPAIILVAMSLIGVGVMVFVVPKFITIFEQVQMELPLMTKLLIAVSGYITENGALFLIISLTALITLIQFLRMSTGKKFFHFIILKIPIIAPIIQKINLARFARTMSSLLKTDIKIAESFQITANTLNNVHYKKSLREASEKVIKGEEIHAILAQYPHLYTNVITQMIAIGEESGELDNILLEIADFYEEEVQQVMNTLPTVIEPLIIILLAIVIGAMAVAIIMPMYSLTNAF